MQFRPCIDLHNGKVKQIVGGTLDDSGADENFISTETPGYYSRLYKKYNLTGGHVIKLGPGNDDAALEALKAWPGGLQIGGGITSDNAVDYLDAGASHVIVTSHVFSAGEIRMDRLEALLKAVGKERLVLDLSCRKRGDQYVVVTDRWQKFTDFPVNAENLERLSAYCDEFLIHGVDVEGLKAGIEEPLVELIGTCSPIPSTYAGGVRNKSDIQRINTLGKGSVNYTVGSALDIFGGTLPFMDLVKENSNEPG